MVGRGEGRVAVGRERRKKKRKKGRKRLSRF